MDKIIRSLYAMQVDGRFEEFMKPYRGKKEEVFRGYLALKEKLSEEMAQELEEVMEGQLDMLTLELEECFAEGFRLGAQLMCEVFRNEEESSE